MRRKNKLGAILLSGVLATSMLFSSLGNVQANETDYVNVPDGTVYKYNESDPLYAATHFHFFAQEKAVIRAHCHGNVATNVFSAGANSGSNKLGALVKSEIFYFREADASGGFIADFAGATVVIGAETGAKQVNGVETGFYLNDGTTYKKIEPNSTVYTEKGTETADRYIDLDAEFAKLTALSTHLAGQTASTTVTLGGDTANKTINFANQAGNETTSFVNIKHADVSGTNDFKIANIDNFKNGKALVINYEIPSGTTNYTIPFTKVIISDKNGDINSQENWGDYTGHGNILWNFYTTDTNGNVIPYTGTINTCDLFKGTILAPQATIKMSNSNQDGNFIGKNVYGGGGETHRWDFGGYLPRPNTATAPTTGSLDVIVKEAGTGTPIEGAEVKITNITGYEKTFTTSANGKLDIPNSDGNILSGLTAGSYTVTVTAVPTGYNITTQPVLTKTVKESTTVQYPFEIAKTAVTPTPTPTGSLRVYVVDAVTNLPIENVTVKINDPAGSEVNTLTTGSNGYTTVESGLTIRANDTTDVYKVTVTSVPEGYIIPTSIKTQAITDTTLRTVPIYLQKEATGSIQATIVDDVYNCSVPGTQITVTDENGNLITTLITNAEGKTNTIDKLPLGKTYTVEVKTIPDGSKDGNTHKHPLPAKKTVTLTTDKPDVIVPFVTSPEPHGALQVLVQDRFTREPIKDATVEIYNYNGILVDTLTTGTTGETKVLTNLSTTTNRNTYTIKVTSVPKGYTAPLDSTVTLTTEYDESKPDTIQKEVMKVHQSGSLQATIVDEKKLEPIPNATGTLTVTQVAPNGTVTTTDIPFTTDAEGKTQIVDKLKLDSDVTIKVTTVPSCYNKPSDSTVKIETTELTEETLKVKKEVGSLQATIVDSKKGTPIPNATGTLTVTQVANDGTETTKDIPFTTDENGQTKIIDDLKITSDVTIKVNTVPKNYNIPDDSKVKIETTELTKETLKVIKVTGSLQATIIDETTNKPIPDADVKVEDSHGTTVYTGKTDSNGKTEIITELPVDETYTIVTEKVPVGYNPPADKDITVITPSPALTTVTLTVKPADPLSGCLQATIKDKNTNAPIKNAKVEIKDNTGKVVATVTTDDKGITPIVNNLSIGTTYTIHVVSVPSGYTAPDDKLQLISNSALVRVDLVVAKTPDSNINTGDNTNVFAIGFLTLISLAGIFVLTKKKQEL